MKMNTLVVYFSKFGNTQKAAEAVGRALETAGAVRFLALDRLTAAALEGVDLVVMGTPTHRMNLPEAIQPALADLPKRILCDVRFAAFDSSYKLSGFLARFTAAPKLARKLGCLGGKRVLPPETFHVAEKEGPL
jgi:flavodoxin